jgi:hypothetical protein
MMHGQTNTKFTTRLVVSQVFVSLINQSRENTTACVTENGSQIQHAYPVTDGPH